MRPTVRSRRLGARLAAYRQIARMTGTEVAEQMGLAPSTWSKVESGTRKLSARALEQAVALLQIPAEIAAQLQELQQRANTPGWWQDYGDILSEPVEMLLELEAEANWVRTYSGPVVPGLLQTRPYAERIIAAAAMHMRVADIDRYLDLRMRRQQRLASGMRLSAVMSEAAVLQRVGGPEVLSEQLEHLLRVSRDLDVQVQVVPFTADAHSALGDQFAIMTWPEENEPEAVYVDGQSSWTVHENSGLIRQYLHSFASVQAVALPQRESLELIVKAREDL